MSTYRFHMETTTKSTPSFSFATSHPWLGHSAETLRILSRARIEQADLRIRRLRRENLAARHFDLESMAPVIDLRERRRRARTVHENEQTRQMVEGRNRGALLDLRRTHEESVRELLAEDELVDLRAPFPILLDAQPRSAVAHRRWG